MNKAENLKNRSIQYYFATAFIFIVGEVLAVFGHWAASQNYINTNADLLFITISLIIIFICLFIFSIASQYENALALAEDLTSRLRKQNKRLVELEDFRQDFFSMVSHQLKTPITAILWTIETLQGFDGKTDKQSKDSIIEIENQARDMNKLINTLLNISRIDSDRLSINPKKQNLKSVIQDLVKNKDVIAKEKDISIDIHCDSQIALNIDTSIFEHIVGNLIDNSIKYSDSGKKIKINVKRNTENNSIAIEVIDEGKGIPFSDQKKIFSKFFRADNVNTIKGTGLGLYLVKKLVDVSGGKINFHSEEDKGTTFSVEFKKSGMITKEGEVSFT